MVLKKPLKRPFHWCHASVRVPGVWLLFLLAHFWASISYAQVKWVIKLWEHERPEIQKLLDEVISNFHKAHPHIKVKRAHYKVEDLRTQYQTAALAKSGPDLVMGPNDLAGPFALMRIIKPVNKLIDEQLFDHAVIKGVQDQEGRIWAVPLAKGNHLILYVNRKLINEIPDVLEEDLFPLINQLASQNKYVLAYNLNEPFWFVPFLAAFGQYPFVDGKPQLNTPAMVRALQFVHDLKFKHKAVPEDCDYTCMDGLFLESAAATVINGDWAIDRYRKVLGEDLVIAPLPKLKITGRHMEPVVSGKYLYLNATTQGARKDAAMQFAYYLISPKIQIFFAKQAGRLPALKSVASAAEIKSDPILTASLAAMAHGQPMPMDVAMRAVWDAMRPQLQQVMAGHVPPAKAAQIMQKDAEQKISDMHK